MTEGLVLVIDDEAEQLTLLQQLLSTRPIKVISCQQASEALAIAVTEQPDLILLDVRMPELDGYQVCRQLKHHSQTDTIPVIFLSAADQSEERVQGFEAGAVDYVTKPFYVDELYARIGLHLELSRKIRAQHNVRSPEVNSLKPDFVSQAIAVLDQETAGPPSLVDLAHRVGTNEQTLNQLFKARTGMTVFGYFRERRMHYACEWLETTDQSVQEIAAKVGYSSNASFATAFKERFGVTPKQYRKHAVA